MKRVLARLGLIMCEGFTATATGTESATRFTIIDVQDVARYLYHESPDGPRLRLSVERRATFC